MPLCSYGKTLVQCVFTFCKCLSLSLGKLGTFALFKLPTLLWGTCIKMNSTIYLKFLTGVFNQTLSMYDHLSLLDHFMNLKVFVEL